jgi:hypothetical protein
MVGKVRGEMPAAGFYTIESHRIVFGRDGNWYSGGERIENPRIALLFSRHLQRRPDGRYELVLGEERADVEVEDTPFVVRQVEEDGKGGWLVALNDGSQEPLDPSTLRIGEDQALRCRVKGGEYEARFLRPAHYALASRLYPGDDGIFYLEHRGERFPVFPSPGR